MKGRKPIPDNLKVLRGTDQPCRLRDELSVTPITDPILSIPKGSPLKSKRAKAIFIGKANQLIALKILTSFDIEQLSVYAYTLDQVYVCMEKIHKLDLFREMHDADGKILRYVENPYIKLLRDMIDITNKIGADFGFSPVSRQKLKAEPEKDKNDLSDLLNGI